MKAVALVISLFAATAVSARSLFKTGQNALVDDPKFPVPGKNPLNFCADPADYILDIDYVDLSPNPPVPGEKLTITANGTFSQTIEPGATVLLQVKYGLITLIKQEADLCDNLPKIDLSCPIDKGVMTLKKEVDIPKQVPPGKYTVLADVNTVDKEKITCMESTVFFTKQ
ncbi:Phosphatidylglycerol/phosphatidylinositol transfer protein [Exophiala dermatitidis]